MNNSGEKTQKKTAWQRAGCLARDNSGVIMVITAVVFPALLAFAGLSLDIGMTYDLKRRQKNAAVAGALGGAHEKFRGSGDADVITAAKEDTKRNAFDDADANVTVTVNIPPTSGTHQTADFVEVIITGTVSTYFARLWGQETVTVQSRAVAGAIPYADGCVIALDPSASETLRVTGSASLESQCGIFVNSTASDALRTNGGGCVTATAGTSIAVTGGYTPNPASCINPTPLQAPPLYDPLHYLSAVSIPNGCDFVNTKVTNETVTLAPGRYCGNKQVKEIVIAGVVISQTTYEPAIKITGGNVTFLPGLYILDAGMSISGGVVRGDGVTFYNTNNQEQPAKKDAWVTFKITGNADIQITAPTSGDTAGMLFWEDPAAPEWDFLDPTVRRFHKFAGNSTSILGGALYFPSSQVRWEGTSLIADWSMIVADTIRVDGNATVAGGLLNESDIPVAARKPTLVE